MEKQKNLTVLKQSDKDFLRSLENCIQFGTPVLLENVGESLDPALEPLLQKQTFQQGGSVCIKLGESTIEYSKEFRMYITTRLKNPHFPPETTAKIAMVNFSISKAGLVDQLLGIIVARERPELEEERSQIIGQINENKKNLGDIENKILSVLYTSKGNILEDENAIKTLSSSKVLANEIVEKQHACEAAKGRIDENRNDYLDLTHFAVTLFFTGNYLSMINHMYQFSLAWFINLFCTSIDVADKSEELEERLNSIKEHFLRSLFVNTSASLFEEDKIVYSFLLACNLGQTCKGVMETDAWQFFLKLIKEAELEGKSDLPKHKFIEINVRSFTLLLFAFPLLLLRVPASFNPAPLISRSFGLPLLWSPTPLVSQSFGFPLLWVPAPLVSRSFGFPLLWVPAPLVSRFFGLPLILLSLPYFSHFQIGNTAPFPFPFP